MRQNVADKAFVSSKHKNAHQKQKLRGIKFKIYHNMQCGRGDEEVNFLITTDLLLLKTITNC